MNRILWLVVFAGLGLAPALLASDADRQWKAFVAMDRGPSGKPGSPEQATIAARAHLAAQRRAAQDFLAKYPGDSRAPEARIRLANILAAEGMMNSQPASVSEALSILLKLETDPAIPAGLQADAAFRRASIAMQTVPQGPERGYRDVVAAARRFSSAFPQDRRTPRILVEAATVCDADPSLKRELLEEARKLTTDNSLRRRILDDLTRLDLLGKPLQLVVPSLRGGSIKTAELLGKPVVVIFWSPSSPQSLLWLRDFRADWESSARSQFDVLTIAVDSDRKAVSERAAHLPPQWLAGYEPGGWEAPTIRSLGLNALPTVWVLDAGGSLRSLNARSSWQKWIARLKADES
ncbi:MAG: hypothetical protein Fur0032_22070 [Terrimicrobiaceae bacterium]